MLITPSLVLLLLALLAAAFGLGFLLGWAMNAPCMDEEDEHAKAPGQWDWYDKP